MPKATFEYGALSRITAALLKDTTTLAPRVKETTGKALLEIKKGAQQRVSGHRHLPYLARSFSYDVWTRGTTVIGEVGALHERRQGRLDNIIEYGGLREAPIPHWAPEVEQEVPVWARHLDEILLEQLR